tara:strand:+ start:1127 stop:2125 length:999 start_codon:yes stop_codon:yes gene_type:complete
MLNWCIVGSGDVVNRLVVDSLNIKNKSKVVAILSNDLNQAKNLAKKIDVNRVYLNTDKNKKKIKEDKIINSIYIATPPDSHFYYIKYFCRNKKNIICEKPLVKKLSELKKLELLKKNNKFNLLTCFYRRYLDRFIFIKKILAKKTIGKVMYFNIRYFHNEKNHPTAKIKNKNIPWRFVKKISGGGNIMDMGIHSIDLVDFLLGKINSVYAFNQNYKKIYDVEDTTVLNIKLYNGILGQGSWSSVSNDKQDLFEIYGLNGSIKFSANYNEDENIYIKKKSNLKKIRIPYNLPLHKNMMKNYVDLLIANNKKNKFYFMENGKNTLRIMSKIIKL